MEVPARIEPANGGFADPCLTTWLRHHKVVDQILADLYRKITLISLLLLEL